MYGSWGRVTFRWKGNTDLEEELPSDKKETDSVRSFVSLQSTEETVLYDFLENLEIFFSLLNVECGSLNNDGTCHQNLPTLMV